MFLDITKGKFSFSAYVCVCMQVYMHSKIYMTCSEKGPYFVIHIIPLRALFSEQVTYTCSYSYCTYVHVPT